MTAFSSLGVILGWMQPKALDDYIDGYSLLLWIFPWIIQPITLDCPMDNSVYYLGLSHGQIQPMTLDGKWIIPPVMLDGPRIIHGNLGLSHG